MHFWSYIIFRVRGIDDKGKAEAIRTLHYQNLKSDPDIF